jgi:DNA-binding NtrC family response regulator
LDFFQRIQVLYVDVDEALLTTTKQILDLQNSFQVETASSVNERLEKLEKISFDVTVSDF